jgi:sensor histidine kinase YesM
MCLGVGFAITLISGINKEQLRFAGWLRDLSIYVIFCEIIGFSNLIICNLLPEMERIKSKLWREIYLAGEFTIASLLGTFLSLVITSWLLGKQIPRIGLAPFVLMVLGFSILASYGIFFYLQMKERLQIAAVQLKEREVLAERLEKLKAAAELSALQSRIQPHFLFNTLNSIAALIREDPSLAEATTEKLAELFRHVLDSNRREYITLGEEMSIIQHYLEIEKLRLGERLRFRIDMDATLENLQVPGLIIQPLVDNSIKHGIAPLEEGGEILVSAKLSDGRCLIAVQDSGAGFDVAQNNGGYGLQNIHDRLKNLYGDAAGFKMTSSLGEGARVEIILPMAASEK